MNEHMEKLSLKHAEIMNQWEEHVEGNPDEFMLAITDSYYLEIGFINSPLVLLVDYNVDEDVLYVTISVDDKQLSFTPFNTVDQLVWAVDTAMQIVKSMQGDS